jgi:hypothetical protein
MSDETLSKDQSVDSLDPDSDAHQYLLSTLLQAVVGSCGESTGGLAVPESVAQAILIEILESLAKLHAAHR